MVGDGITRVPQIPAGRSDSVIRITGGRGTGHTHNWGPSSKLYLALMNDFGVLNSRKRAVIALIHSFVFLGIAFHGFASQKTGILHSPGTTGDFVLIGIYLVVASILAWLVTISRCLRERIYFALCTTSATFGLLRTVFGDSALPVAQYMRVIMLSSAVAVGFLILRAFSRPIPEEVLPE